MPIKQNLKTYSVDEYGVRNYNSFYLAVFTLIALYSIIGLLAVPLVYFESAFDSANITTYRDAFWTLQMSASTIGFGDHFPVSNEGRLLVALMFYIGVGMVGYIGAQVINRFTRFSDTNIKNRELRKQNSQLIDHNLVLEQKIDRLLSQLESSNSQANK